MDSRNATSLPGLVVGPTQLGLLDGLTSAPSGPAPVRVSRSHLLGRDSAHKIRGTYGPTSFASSVPYGPLSSWESRLRQRLATHGSTEWDLIWKVKTTPGGRVISRLAASTRRIRNRLYWVAESARELHNGRWVARQRRRSESSDRSGGHSRRMEHADFEGLAKRAGAGENALAVGPSQGEVTGSSGNAWADCELIGPDPNGKYRRTKLGVRLLAHGIPGRVGRLRGYGNSIIPSLAAEVIASWMEATA